MIAPEGFQQSLRAFDSMLNVRRGEFVGKWVIERKAHIPEMELSFLRRRRERTFRIARRKSADKAAYEKTLDLAKQIAEETESAERGYRVIVMADELNDRIFNMLGLSDTRRYGGFSRYVEEMEQKEQKGAKDVARQDANEREAMHKDAYDKLNFVWNHRETQLLDGKRNMADLLR